MTYQPVNQRLELKVFDPSTVVFVLKPTSLYVFFISFIIFPTFSRLFHRAAGDSPSLA